MKRLINKKIRDTNKMSLICARSGNRNDCYSTFCSVLQDERDNTFYAFYGNNWSGLGPDTLEPISDVISFIEENFTSLGDDEVKRVEKLL